MTFLEAYKIYSSGTESSPSYHEWCGLSILASACSRRIFINQGRFTRYPNLYILLVGDPASGKSTAMSFARRMVKDFGKVQISPASITKEALTQLMGKADSPCKKQFTLNGKVIDYTPISIFANELVTLLGTEPARAIDFFTDIWDEPVHVVATKNKGCDDIPGPFVNLLGCLTPATVDGLFKQKLITGGFARRTIFVADQAKGSPVPFPEETPEQQEAYSFCLRRIHELDSMKGEVLWSPEAKEIFHPWYIENNARMHEEQDPATKGYLRSKDEIVMKLALLMTMSKGNDMLLKGDTLQEALDQLRRVEPNMRRVLVGSGRNVLASISTEILNYLKAQSRPVLQKKIEAIFNSKVNNLELVECLSHLVRTDCIKKTEITEPGKPPLTQYTYVNDINTH